MVALASLCAGAASAQPDPEFGTKNIYPAPVLPSSIAATPAGKDIVGTGVGLFPDGYPEIAVAAEINGFIRFYRNQNTWCSNPGASLTAIYDLNVYTPLNLVASPEGDARITHIELEDLTNEGVAGLVVSIIYIENPQTNPVAKGKIAHFRADLDEFTGAFTGHTLRSFVDLELPVTGFTLADYSQDNRIDILAACVASAGNPTENPARAYIIENVDDAAGVPGLLFQHPDEVYQAGIGPSANIVAGEFHRLSAGGLGGGTANTLDFVSFGAFNSDPDNGEIILGRGDGVNQLSFQISSRAGSFCANVNPLDEDIDGLSTGHFSLFMNEPDYPESLVLFDPFANRNQSLAADTSPTSLRLLHNDSRSGSFFHLCNGVPASVADIPDYYDVSPNCGGGVTIQSRAPAYLTSGNLNGDTFDDLLHLNPNAQQISLLTGRGTPDANNRIMKYDCANPNYQIENYGGSSGGNNLDQAVCVDLNLDGLDEIVVSRNTEWSSGSNLWNIVVFVNLTNPCSTN